MEKHELLMREIATLAWYAHYLAEAIEDRAVAPAGKTPCVAAAKYLIEAEDLIPDTDPQFGAIDDLFVALIGLAELLRAGGRETMAKYSAKPLPPSGTLGARLKEVKANFGGFWNYIAREVTPGFQEVARAVRKEPDLVGPLVAHLRQWVQTVAQRPILPVNIQSLELFLRHHTAKSATRSSSSGRLPPPRRR